ncbi:MAG: hypothetical protein ACKESB_00340 [Candidatus Hodgkinia cicadicola]
MVTSKMHKSKCSLSSSAWFDAEGNSLRGLSAEHPLKQWIECQMLCFSTPLENQLLASWQLLQVNGRGGEEEGGRERGGADACPFFDFSLSLSPPLLPSPFFPFWSWVVNGGG